ncbi:MAG: Trk system potassium transporter TrkA [Negativicutes bacterium]|nr:Trk system potassium transporter TrkA [Negativicutes bacterium]
MKIVIVGAGKVGFTLAQKLTQEEHDVIVIEKDDERRSIIEDHLDVMTVAGNGASPRLLKDIGIADAGMMIAVTDSDEVNMIACLAAKQAGVPKAIARVRNTEYLEQDCQSFGKTFGIDLIINPEMVTAVEISQILKTPAALDVEDFAGGKVRMLEVKIRVGSPFSGKPLRELSLPPNVLIAGILRKDKMIIPHGGDQIEDNDCVFFLGEKEAICGMEDLFIEKRTKLERILIIGAGRIGRYLTLILENSGYTVKVIDKDRRRCEELAKAVDKAMILCGDGTDMELLTEEGIGDFDAVVCLTDDDKLNLLVALTAKHFGAQKTFARVGRPEYISLMEQVGVDVVFSPRLLTAGAILRQVRRGEIVSVMLFEGSKAEAIELDIGKGNRLVGKRLKDLKFPQRALVGAVVRDQQTILPNGDTVLQVGDRAIIFTLPDRAAKVLDFLEGRE